MTSQQQSTSRNLAAAVSAEREIDELGIAIVNRTIIGQAQGILENDSVALLVLAISRGQLRQTG
ncbi:hypothetical protein [Nocardioides sp.]|uniref:hypothetical protein n=1 Tax=Nocardioides sp. TaxID=35761 RepID=UPI00261C5ECE|nr:hypothetical protein [Nocardioides sp.]